MTAAIWTSLFSILALPISHADNSERLQQLQQDIGRLESTINVLQHDRSTAYTNLVKLERRLGTLRRDIRSVDRQLNRKERDLNKSRQLQKSLQHKMGQQKQSISAHIRTAYLLGKQAHLKLLLNQERVGDVSRSLTYYRYLTRARLERIDSMQSSLSRQRHVNARITKQKNELTQLRQKKLKDRAEIDSLLKERRQLLAKLDRRLQKSDTRLRELREDERRLEKLLGRIRTVSEPVSVIPPLTGRFSHQKNKLKLPVSGRVLARFGTRRNVGDQRWNGIFISATAGRNIRSVYAGRVVFAGWLHGFGLLMILDHGEGYMTLYGHNQSLYKVVGDQVKTGEIIASVGDTGNPPRTGLYFGVRQQGKPRNPLIWCKVSR